MAQMVSVLEHRAHLRRRNHIVHTYIRAMQPTARSLGADKGLWG